MGDFNLDLSEVEKANEVAESTTACTTSEPEEKGNNVVFYIIMGVLCLSGIGIPVLAILLWKEKKKRKQLEEQLNNKPAEAKEQPSEKTEEKSEEKKESQEEKTPEK